jgi:outer membrane lipoprotein-sorting protein
MLARSRRVGAALGAGVLLWAPGCASARLPPPETIARARSAATYSASLRFSLSGPDLRGRGRAIVAFARPDRLRVEVPGPAGARVVAVLSEGSLVATFPGEHAVFRDVANEASLHALFGLALAPAEMMDALVGVPSASLRSYRVRWGRSLPRTIEAEMSDGARLTLRVDSAEQDVSIPAAAFEPPPHEGYRSVGAGEARDLWNPR